MKKSNSHNLFKCIVIILLSVLIVLHIYLIKNVVNKAEFDIVSNLMQNEERQKEEKYYTLEECLNSKINSNKDLSSSSKDYYELSKIIYSYENDNQCVVFYNSVDSTIWMYIIDKNLNDDVINYSVNFYQTVSFFGDSWENCKEYYFNVVKDANSNKEYKGYIPTVTKIDYEKNAEHHEGYFLFIDAS